MATTNMVETCGICGCAVHRQGHYAEPSPLGRSHATNHHYVAERFFGRSKNRPGEQRPLVFRKPPWKLTEREATYCYDCHELLLHNPVLLPGDIDRLRALVVRRRLRERSKTNSYTKLAGRVRLLHDVIDAGLAALVRRDFR